MYVSLFVRVCVCMCNCWNVCLCAHDRAHMMMRRLERQWPMLLLFVDNNPIHANGAHCAAAAGSKQKIVSIRQSNDECVPHGLGRDAERETATTRMSETIAGNDDCFVYAVACCISLIWGCASTARQAICTFRTCGPFVFVAARL